jgi:hypothetical protein
VSNAVIIDPPRTANDTAVADLIRMAVKAVAA